MPRSIPVSVRSPVAIVAWAANLPILHAVLATPSRGLDAMDESHYLMAAQPWASDKAFNGMFGWYSGPLLRAVGEDLGRLRVLAAVLLVVAALVLARAVRGFAERAGGVAWPPALRALVPPAVVAAALCYYTVFVRTPSYNWFAAVGLMLLAAGLLEVLRGPETGRAAVLAGVLVASGAFVTAVGKATTALAAALVVALAIAVRAVTVLWPGAARTGRRALGQAALAAMAAGLVLAGLHLTAVHSLSFTVATYQRVSGMLSVVDPGHYAPGTLGPAARAGLRNLAIDRPRPFLGLLALPAVAVIVVLLWRWLAERLPRAVAAPGRGAPIRPGWWLAAAHALAWWVTLAVVLWDYPGGVPGLGMSIPPLIVAGEAALLVAALALALHLLDRPRPPSTVDDRHPGPDAARDRHPASALLAAVALFALGLAYPVGTNVEYATQLHGGFPVLLAAAVIGLSALPDGAAPAAVASLGVGALVLGAVLVPTTRLVAPYRIAPMAEQTVPRQIVPGTPEVLVDPTTAAWIDDLRALGVRGGFAPGTPLLDLTWHPASVLILDGRAPSVLLPAFPGWPNVAGSAQFALRQEEESVWSAAWVLVPFGQDDALTAPATAVVGREFPTGYELVGTVTAPYDRQVQGLWRPRG